MTKEDVAASFRDPSGFLFRNKEGVLLRQVNQIYRDDYEALMGSGLYEELTEAGLLVPHEEVDISNKKTEDAYKVIKPRPLKFISYPYEWCFSQLQDAALATLNIQKRALKHNLSLKDASAYNVQFSDSRPIFIDTLSFEKYTPGLPWVAYRQFCQHFLAPLALMSRRDVRLNQLAKVYIDGVPLDLAAKLLPAGTRLSFSLLTHIHLHAKGQKSFADKREAAGRAKLSKNALHGLIDNLTAAVRKLKWQPRGTEWADYYKMTNYDQEAFAHKRKLVDDYLAAVSPAPGAVWDLGANLGLFSRLSAAKNIPTIAFDIDPAAVEKNYRRCLKDQETNILPLLMDLTNPSPDIGWRNRERDSFFRRGPVDLVLALAIVHHLAIANNVPLPRLADFFADLTNWLIIEFIPKEDSQTRKLLAAREDIFTDYNRETFESEFKKRFTIKASETIANSRRTLYLLKKS